jgi:hypothetical protein
MLDNQLFAALRSVILAGLSAANFPNVAVEQSNQPTQQGINSGPTVRFTKLYDHLYGVIKRDSQWDANTGKMVNTALQYYETTVQVDALLTQDPADVNSITASDLVNTVAVYLQDDPARLALQALGIGILKITEVRNPYFKNDRDQFTASPSFDFTLVHERVIVTTAPVVKSIKIGVYRV